MAATCGVAGMIVDVADRRVGSGGAGDAKTKIATKNARKRLIRVSNNAAHASLSTHLIETGSRPCVTRSAVLESLTAESFEPHIGTSFWAEFTNGSKVELRLLHAAKVMESEAARLPRHPFSLFFAGPRSFLLKQHIYRLTHDVLEPMEIFLVPVGEEAHRYLYEAVFT